MKKRKWKKIISLLMCALLLFSVIDLSGNGFVRAEDSAYVSEEAGEAADTSEDNTETPVDETSETENEISDEAPESENEISDEPLGTENARDRKTAQHLRKLQTFKLQICLICRFLKSETVDRLLLSARWMKHKMRF